MSGSTDRCVARRHTALQTAAICGRKEAISIEFTQYTISRDSSNKKEKKKEKPDLKVDNCPR